MPRVGVGRAAVSDFPRNQENLDLHEAHKLPQYRGALLSDRGHCKNPRTQRDRGCRACGICLGIGNRGLVPARLPMRDAAWHGVQYLLNVYSGPQLQPPTQNQNNAWG